MWDAFWIKPKRIDLDNKGGSLILPLAADEGIVVNGSVWFFAYVTPFWEGAKGIPIDVGNDAGSYAEEKPFPAVWPRITVKLNGVLVHENLELAKNFTTSAPLTNALAGPTGPIHLQSHGNPVVFRNIWVVSGK